MPRKNFLTQENADRIRQLTDAGMLRKYMPDVLGFTCVTISKICRKFNIPRAPNHPRWETRKEEIRDQVLRLSKTMNQDEIVKILKCSHSTITKIMREDNPYYYGGRGPRKIVETPKWLPVGWEDEYREIARFGGEQAASKWAREAKRQAALDGLDGSPSAGVRSGSEPGGGG